MLILAADQHPSIENTTAAEKWDQSAPMQTHSLAAEMSPNDYHELKKYPAE